ncbi:hypothetical protein [Pimelobacter simplex]|uniref:hypothetical protein n=1 Tax=Nocardioides simplex TaxID=2045 RepID=UPI00214FF990|nr:hypothetical protein [Pimelobacter simplex]UUW88119.1 hypothetical protein M0M43_20575 [Pimelobacter simplex]UUW97623.1 hypothetical protein M0M48_09220 [Pimelobacter simplex]
MTTTLRWLMQRSIADRGSGADQRGEVGGQLVVLEDAHLDRAAAVGVLADDHQFLVERPEDHVAHPDQVVLVGLGEVARHRVLHHERARLDHRQVALDDDAVVVDDHPLAEELQDVAVVLDQVAVVRRDALAGLGPDIARELPEVVVRGLAERPDQRLQVAVALGGRVDPHPLQHRALARGLGGREPLGDEVDEVVAVELDHGCCLSVGWSASRPWAAKDASRAVRSAAVKGR